MNSRIRRPLYISFKSSLCCFSLPSVAPQQLLGKSFRVEYVYKDIHFIFTIYFMGKYYSDDLSVSVSPVKVHKLPTDIALSNSLAAFKNAISNIY